MTKPSTDDPVVSSTELSAQHRVTFVRSELSILVRPGETIVEALRRHGLRTRYKCRRGGCGVCRATVVSGEVTYPSGVCLDVVRGDDAPAADGFARCLPCRAVPASDVRLLLGPEDDVVDVLATVLRTNRPPHQGGADVPVPTRRSNLCQ